MAKKEVVPADPWKNKQYWLLPESVRKAIDIAQKKQRHSDFYYRLETLNDKIYIFRSIYYTNMPSFQRAFMEKKRKALEEKLQK